MQKNWANISAGWIYSSNNVNVILSREMFWQPPTWFFPWYKLQQRNKSKSLFFLLAAPCKNILELCVVEVSQPGGMNLEFAVCLVHEESAAGAAGYNRRWCRVQLQVKRTWQTDLECLTAGKPKWEGTWGGELTNDHGRGHIKGTLFKIGHLWISRSYCISVFTQLLTVEIQIIWAAVIQFLSETCRKSKIPHLKINHRCYPHRPHMPRASNSSTNDPSKTHI